MLGATTPASRSPVDRVIAVMAAWTFPIYSSLVCLYVLFRVGSFTNMPDRVTDTPSYETVARHAPWDWRFYSGGRGFTYPLFLKLFHGSESRTVAQLVFSTAAWLVLAAVVASCIRGRRLRPIAFAAILGFSLTTEVVLWDTVLLSESVTFALAALLLAAWILLVRSPRVRWAAAVLVLSLFWAFARDTNAYVALVIAVLVGLTLVRPDHRRLKAVLVAGLCAIFLLGYVSADAGKRWLQPMIDIVDHRVINTPSMERYFVAHGFPAHTNWPLGSWIRNHSRSTYLSYLLKHPGYALITPLHGRQQTLWTTSSNAASLVDPNVAADNASHRFLPLPGRAEKILFPRGVALVCALLMIVLAGAGLVARRFGWERLWLAPLALLLTTYPHFLVVWHQSGIEVDRHALEAALLLRIGLLLLALFAIDRALSSRARTAPEQSASQSPRPTPSEGSTTSACRCRRSRASRGSSGGRACGRG
jgi:hypothetical protein